MNASTRARRLEAMVGMVGLMSSVVMLLAASSPAAAAEAIVRFTNGREMVVRDHWIAGSQMLFTHKLGTIGVPSAFVVAIQPLPPARKIGGTSGAVNARPLVAPHAFR